MNLPNFFAELKRHNVYDASLNTLGKRDAAKGRGVVERSIGAIAQRVATKAISRRPAAYFKLVNFRLSG